MRRATSALGRGLGGLAWGGLPARRAASPAPPFRPISALRLAPPPPKSPSRPGRGARAQRGRGRSATLCLLLLLATAPAFAKSTATTVPGAHGPEIVLENQFLKVTVEPGYGARVMSLVYKPLNREIVAPVDRDQQGMFMDALGGENWSADFGMAPYTYEIKSPGPEAAVLSTLR